MNFFKLLFLAYMGTSALMAQKPLPVYGFARVHQPLSWYKQQAVAWKNVVESNPKNAEAWYNYFRVSKNLFYRDTTDVRPMTERWAALGKLVEDMNRNIPDTYEYNYCKWSFEGNNFEYVSYLKRADELADGRTLHFDYMVNWGEMERDISKRDLYCRKMYEAGDVSPGLLYYNYNVIAGTKPNAIIFTEGDNDTYPIWVLQSQNVRRDVVLLNLALLRIDQYREKVFRELGVDNWDMSFTKGRKDTAAWSEDRFKREVIKRVAANKKKYPVYVAVTVTGCNDYTKPVEDNLYLVGLTYQYSTGPIDNMAVMKRNFEREYALDYIDKMFFRDISEERVFGCNGNYIVPMLKLYDHYKESGDSQKAEWIRKKLLFISNGNPSEQEIKKHLAQN